MRTLLPTLLLLGAVLPMPFAVTAAEKPAAATDKFEFYNNYWVNLHHFLYDKALKEAPALTTDSLENALIQSFADADRRIYDQAVEFYRKYLAQRSLVADSILREIHICLTGTAAKNIPNCKTLEAEHVQLFKNFDLVYRKYFWKWHSEQNLRKLNEYLKTIRLVEKDLLTRIANWSGTEWKEGKIPVQLTVHASRSGSYYLLNPLTITISTATERLAGTLFIEMLFHEAAHSIISSTQSAIALQIDKAAKAVGKQPPLDFWHMVLFYLVGEATKEVLGQQGITHQTYMERYEIAKRYYPLLADNMSIYLDNKISLYEALRRTIDKAQY